MNKTKLFGAIVLVVLAAMQSGTCAALTAQYAMDEGQGLALYDSSDNNNNGTLTGASWVDGISGSALDFDNQGGRVEIPNSSSLNIGGDAITLTAWFKLTEQNDSGAFVFKNSQYILRLDNQGRLGFSLYLPAWTSVSMEWPDRILDSQWHYTAAVYDGTEMAIYLDGMQVAAKAAAGNIQQRNTAVLIGSQTDGTFQFGGLLDNVSIYDRALTGQEIATMALSPTPVPEPSTMLLGSLGAALTGWLRRRNRV